MRALIASAIDVACLPVTVLGIFVLIDIICTPKPHKTGPRPARHRARHAPSDTPADPPPGAPKTKRQFLEYLVAYVPGVLRLEKDNDLTDLLNANLQHIQTAKVPTRLLMLENQVVDLQLARARHVLATEERATSLREEVIKQ